jgi:hypothetical protein
MAVNVQTEHMALGGWSVDLNWSVTVQELLTREDDGRRVPRKVHLLIYRDDTLVHPPLPLLRYTPSDEGVNIGGRSALWWLGSGDIGPTIIDREYVSGANKLGNPTFAEDDLYWRLPAEGSLWTFSGGNASNVGGNPKDDVLESDEKFPTRPGYSYRLLVSGITGTGRLRLRTLFEGQFNPPNLWVNGDLQDGTTGWTPSAYATIVNDPANAYGDQEWVMRCSPIPQPQYISDPGLETGGGWTETSEAPGDIAIVNDPANAYQGSYVMQCGPVTQKQQILNPEMESHAYWYENTADPDADPSSVYYVDVGFGMEGSTCLTTNGNTHPAAEKYLRAQFDSAPGVTPAPVVSGEEWELETFVWADTGTTGRAWANLHIPHPSVDAPRYYPTQTLELERESANPPKWIQLSTRVSIPNNRFVVNVVLNALGNDAGFLHWDNTTLTRRRGNRAETSSDVAYAIDSDSRYELAARIRSGDDLQVGNVRLGVRMEGPAVDDQVVDKDQGYTDYLWTNTVVDIKPPTGYVWARPFVAALDIIGAPVYVDWITFTKVEGNTTTITGTGVPVTPERTYNVRARFRSGLALARGNARIRVRMVRSGYPDVLVESTPIEATANEWIESQSLSVTPPSGYDEAVPTVVFTDVEGDFFYAADFSMVDADTGTVVFDAVTSTNPIGANSFVDSTAPDGATDVRVMVVAETGSSSWTVGEMSLARTGVTPATAAAIVAELLTDPDTGDTLSVVAGTITAPDVIPYDWQIANLTNREALDHLVSVIAEPALEYRLNATMPPSLDVGEPSVVFTDHLPSGSSPVVYRRSDIDVAEMPSVEVDVEDRPTHVRVYGAVRKTVSGSDFLVTAIAAVPGTAETDYQGRPVNRVLPINDATVDHIGYAQALADDIAARLADPPLSVTAKLHPVDPESASLLGLNERPAHGVGEWIYVHSPEHGLSEDGHKVMIAGEWVNPRRVRIIGDNQEHGPQYKAKVRKEDGTVVDLPGVIWSKEDSRTLTLGDRPVEWVNDPQGGAAGSRYLRDRRAAPR